MIKRIDHIAIAVNDLDEAKKFFVQGLGGKEIWSAAADGQGFRWTTLDLGSSCMLELVSPEGEQGFLQRFLEKRGNGAHHITIQVNDIEKTQSSLAAHGIQTFGQGEPYPGWKELYIHPKNAFGILIQFAEFEPADWIEAGNVPDAYQSLVNERIAADILQLGDPRLRKVAERVADFESAELKSEIDRLKKTLKLVRTILGFGRAVAAVQIGVAKQIVAVDLGQGPFVVINPEITKQSNETFTLWDDCLSFPDLLVKVRRSSGISLAYQDENGLKKEMTNLDRATAELFQHEIDHLNGILAIDRAVDKESIVSRSVFEANPDYFEKQLD
jgi:peptide deformylase